MRLRFEILGLSKELAPPPKKNPNNQNHTGAYSKALSLSKLNNLNLVIVNNKNVRNWESFK